jgi:transcriptional regulator with XRE-family HTH domain
MSVSAISSNHSGARLHSERERQGFSLRELAYFAGCSHGTLQRAEAGNVDMAPALKARIARALRVPLAELWPLTDPIDALSPAGQPSSAEASVGALGEVAGANGQPPL